MNLTVKFLMACTLMTSGPLFALDQIMVQSENGLVGCRQEAAKAVFTKIGLEKSFVLPEVYSEVRYGVLSPDKVWWNLSNKADVGFYDHYSLTLRVRDLGTEYIANSATGEYKRVARCAVEGTPDMWSAYVFNDDQDHTVAAFTFEPSVWYPVKIYRANEWKMIAQ